MKRIGTILNARTRTLNITLLVLLVIASVAVSYFIAKTQTRLPPFTIIAGLIGIAAAGFTLIYPAFGFYASITITFFIFDVIRYTRTDLPVGTLIDGMVFITFIGVMLNKIVIRERFWKNCRSPITFAYLVLILFTIIEFFNPDGGSQVLFFLIIRRVITLFLFFYIAIQLFTDMKAIEKFIKVFVGLCLIAALYACYETWVGFPKFELDYIRSNPLGEKLASLDNGDYRKSSFLSDFTSFGILLSSITGVVLAVLLRLKTTWKNKLFLLVATIILLLGMSYTGTRTAVFMFVMEVALYILMTLSEKRTVVFAGVFAVIFAVVVFGPIYGNSTINRIRTTFLFSKDESLEVRDINRHNIQPYIYAHPIGGGLGTTGIISLEYNPGHPLAGFPTDSGMLRIALEYGWIGLLLQSFIYFLIMQQGARGYFEARDPRRKMYLLGATLALFGYVVAQYAQVAIGPVPGAFLFFALLAMIIRMRQIEKQHS